MLGWTKKEHSLHASNNFPHNVIVKDYQLGPFLGVGSFGHVVLSNNAKTQELVAVKILKRAHIVKTQTVKYVIREKSLLEISSHAFIVRFIEGFKDNANLYIILEYVPCATLYSLIHRIGSLSEKHAPFYAAQIVLGIEYLHTKDILHRDLKPENILLSEDGYIKLTDFGFAKIVSTRTYTLCGTPEYFAPEVCSQRGYGKAAEWWSIGVFIYELCTGSPPYIGRNPDMYLRIRLGQYPDRANFSDDLRSILSGLMNPDLTKRLGNLVKGSHDIKYHTWFRYINWDDLLKKNIVATIKVPARQLTDFKSAKQFKSDDLDKSSVELYAKEFTDF